MFRVRVSLRASGRVFPHHTRFPGHSRLMSIRSGTQAERLAKLKEVYAPFATLSPGSQEYDTLAHSGKVWENYFQPQNTKPYDEIQHAYGDILAEIDGWKEVMKAQIPGLGKALASEYAHQSVALENNPIQVGESQIIFDLMEKEVLGPSNLAALSAQELAGLALPHYHSSTNPSAVTELMNHIVASHWIAVNATSYPGSPGLDETEVRQLAALAIRGTDAEAVYASGWGGRVALGGYRKAPITVKSNHLCIFPYPQEVAACMKRFWEWRDARHYSQRVHPLIHACHMKIYLVHIHPFPDGNGRVSRMLMHDYMLRQGYLPVVMQGLERKDYIEMVGACQDGEPEDFVLQVLRTQLEQLQIFYARQKMQ